jgi:hypothetical protein
MANATLNADVPPGSNTPPARGPSVRAAMITAVLGAIAATAATLLVLRNEYGVGIEALFGVAALAGFGVTAYGLIQAVLAVVDSAGERRRQDREVSERRHGERARKPSA